MPRKKTHRCLMCGRSAETLWTLDNMARVGVMYLCEADSAPLQAILDAAGDLPPDQQKPLPERGKEPIDFTVVHKRRRRDSGMAPLLDWTPPS